jgi:FKBP-type peptidyl-prolyl cis-trans isomerase FklB
MLAIFATQITLMKKYSVAAFCLLLTLAAIAQKPIPKKTVSKTATKSTTSASSSPVLKSENDSLSYAIGLSVANFYRQQGIKLNTTLVTKACNDVLSNKKPLLTDDQANLLFMCHSNPQLCAHVKDDEKFLVENKRKANIKTTASGLQYEVVKEGTGMRPNANDTVTVNYKGTLTNGTEFDNSYKRGEPATFSLDHVIRGWTEGLQLMSVGAKYKFYIPYQLGYGLNEMGTIPAGSALVFEVELLNVKRPQ